MSQAMTKELFDQIVAALLPEMDDADARKALVPQSRAMRPGSAGTRKRAGTMGNPMAALTAPNAAPAGPAAARCRSA